MRQETWTFGFSKIHMVDIKKRNGYGFLPEIGLKLSVVLEWIPFLKLLQNRTNAKATTNIKVESRFPLERERTIEYSLI